MAEVEKLFVQISDSTELPPFVSELQTVHDGIRDREARLFFLKAVWELFEIVEDSEEDEVRENIRIFMETHPLASLFAACEDMQDFLFFICEERYAPQKSTEQWAALLSAFSPRARVHDYVLVAALAAVAVFVGLSFLLYQKKIPYSKG